MLFGLLFLVLFLGMAIGAVMGSLTAKFADYGIDENFIESAQGAVGPGSSASSCWETTWRGSALSTH